jgi:hypothetical protein
MHLHMNMKDLISFISISTKSMEASASDIEQVDKIRIIIYIHNQIIIVRILCTLYNGTTMPQYIPYIKITKNLHT